MGIKTVQARVRRGKKYWYCTILQIEETDYATVRKLISEVEIHENLLLEVWKNKVMTYFLLTTNGLLEDLQKDHQVFLYNPKKRRYEETNPPKAKRSKTVYGNKLEINVFGGVWADAMSLYHWKGETDIYPSQVFPFCTP